MKTNSSSIILILLTLFWAALCVAQEGASTPPSANSIDALMENGRQLLQQGKSDKALQVFEEVIKRDASNAEAYFRAGTIYLRLNQVQKGVTYLENSVRLAPDNTKLSFVLAQTYEGAQMLDKAIAEYRKIMEKWPTSQEAKESGKRARVLLGRRLGEQGKFDQALQAFSSVLADYPDDVPAMLDESLTYSFMGRLDDAQAVLEKALKIEPQNAQTHKYLGDVFEKKGDLTRSESQYEQALKFITPGSPFIALVTTKLELVRGAKFMTKGQLVDAQREFEKVLAADAHNPVARFNLATIYHSLGDLPRSQEMLLSLNKDNPSDLSVKLRLGTIYLEQGHLEEAARELEEVAAKGGESPEGQQASKLLVNIRSTLEKKSPRGISNDDRIALYRAIVEKNPDDSKTWFDLGLLYGELRRNDEAIDAFERVSRLNPDDVRPLAILGGLYDDTNKPEKAIEALSRALEMEQDPVQRQRIGRKLALVIAKKSFNAGKLDEAEGEFKAIIADDNDNYIAHFYLALIYTRKERLDDAAAEYGEVLRIVPGHMLAKLSLAAIHEQTGHEEQAVSEYQAVVISGVPGLADQAKTRLDRLMKRVGGFSYNAGYTLNFDSNSNLSPTNPTQELRSDTSGSISYQRKVSGKRLFWALRFSPTYTVYHQQQFDFLTSEVSPSINGVWRDLNWSANYSFSQTDGVSVEQHYNRSNSLYADALKRFSMPTLLPFLTSKEQRGSIPSVWRINANVRTFTSTASPIYDADTYSIGLLLNQASTSGWAWTGGYTFTDNVNSQPSGNDFAYISHGINLQLSKNISPKLSVNGGYNFLYSAYSNPDSVTNFTESRVNKLNSVSLGLNYTINDNLRLFCNYNYQRNSSNLPTGFILSTENVGTAIGIQSPSLGSYHKYGITAGITANY